MIKRLIIIFLLFAPTLVFAQDFSNISALVTLNKDTSAEVEFNLTLQSPSHIIEIFIGDLAVGSVLALSNGYTLSRRECSLGNYIVCQRKDGVASTDWKVKFSVSKFISFFSKQDEFFWIIADGSQKYSIDELLVTLALPAGFYVSEYKTTIYAIKGVGSYSSRIVAPTQIEFRGLDISSGSNFTVVLDVPKGIFSAQVSQRIFNVIAQSVIFLLAISKESPKRCYRCRTKLTGPQRACATCASASRSCSRRSCSISPRRRNIRPGSWNNAHIWWKKRN